MAEKLLTLCHVAMDGPDDLKAIKEILEADDNNPYARHVYIYVLLI